MLSEPCSLVVAGCVLGVDRERIRRIREQIQLVFGRESRWTDAELEQHFTLSDRGELIMIL